MTKLDTDECNGILQELNSQLLQLDLIINLEESKTSKGQIDKFKGQVLVLKTYIDETFEELMAGDFEIEEEDE